MPYLLANNDLQAWLLAAAILAAVVVLLYAFKVLLLRRLARTAPHTDTYLDDLAITILSSTQPLFIFLMGVHAGAQMLALPARSESILQHLSVTVFLLQAARWGDVGIKGWFHHYRLRRSAEDAASTTSTAALGFVARTVLWVVILLMILDNFGVNITTLVASLGIGGIAVALALQNILGDLFSSLSIVLDKPFVVGDFIIVDDVLGTVEYVGLKTTRLRSLGGEQVVFSNSDLLKSRIRNYKHMQTRRIVFGIGITYGVNKEQLRSVPVMLREAVEAQPQAKFDRAHFKSYSPSSIDFEVVYYVQTGDYNVYMDVQQEINLILFERFAEAGIGFAQPRQVVQLAEPATASLQAIEPGPEQRRAA